MREKWIGRNPPTNYVAFDGASIKVSWAQLQCARAAGELRLRVEVAGCEGLRGRRKLWHTWHLPLAAVAESLWASPTLRARAAREIDRLCGSHPARLGCDSCCVGRAPTWCRQALAHAAVPPRTPLLAEPSHAQ